MISIIGVSRGNEYSPNHVDNDAAIFNKVVEELGQLGCEVEVYAEKDFVEQGVKGDIIFDMARDKATIARLKSLEDGGALVINSAYGIDNCVRRPMTELLIKRGVPHPQSFIISTADEYSENCYPCWVKRGDSHAMVKEDVAYATCKEEVENILADFRNRDIPVAVINEHLQGDLVKFYGVHGTDFFYWFYPSPCSHSKFGLEKINGIAKGIPFSVEELIIPSADLRNNYNKISKRCHETKEPIYVTRNGVNDLVVLSDEVFEKMRKQNEESEEERIERLISEKFDKHYKDFNEFKADLLKNVTEAIEEIENGKGIPMEQIVAEMEETYNIGK